MRKTELRRQTNETTIDLSLTIDGRGKSEIKSGVGFLDHMLTLFAKHGDFDLSLRCLGDTEVDDHHSVEDIGIVLGQAFREALGEAKGIKRYGQIILPMDEALILCALDISGRGFFASTMALPTEKIGTFDTELVSEFYSAFAREMRLTLHFQQLAGTNSHHIAEGSFKAFGRALKMALALDPDHLGEVPSTKGMLY